MIHRRAGLEMFALSLGVAVFLLASSGCARQQATASTPKTPVATAEPATRTPLSTEAHVPLRAWYEGTTVVADDRAHEVQFTFEATMPLAALTTAIRGVDGLQVSGGEVRVHGAQTAGAPSVHPFSLRVPATVSGLLAIDVRWSQGGDMRGATLAVRVGAKGAQPKVEKLGRIESGPDGQPVQVMPAEMR